ncbi:protein translocase subunit SecF [Mobilicoccus massiliensis]|uniref:protein translocase subunit SecF n=1 Tax=Mobilicoccus massiliensis TaxID=1522310 RepID=UPI000590DC5C|nr:protein translocase subunit SecF [Mobilicoccus massiliensis]
MSRFSEWGNDLYTGQRSIDFIGRRKLWYVASAVLLLLTIGGLVLRGGINLGIEFTGGSDFRVPGVTNFENFESRASTVVQKVGKVDQAKVTRVGTDSVRVETERFDDRRAIDVRDGLADEFHVDPDSVTSSVIGPSWGQSVTNDAIRALLLFLVLVSVVLAVYFRTWKMAVAAIVALVHDIVFTVGIYAVAGFEVTPASAIGFLTILGYSMYDTVVVFDKVRENTAEAFRRGTMTYDEAVNLAVNQTLVRSINTSVVALLPVAVILVMSWAVIGPGTLRDLSLALFVGIAVGTYSSIFLAPPILVDLRRGEKSVRALRERVERHRMHGESYEQTVAETQGRPRPAPGGSSSGVGVVQRPVTTSMTDASAQESRSPASDGGITATGRPIHPYAQRAQRDEGRRDARRRRKDQGEK